jgi:hypothetical protein
LEVNGDGDALLSLEPIIDCMNDLKTDYVTAGRDLLLAVRNGGGDYFGYKAVANVCLLYESFFNLFIIINNAPIKPESL